MSSGRRYRKPPVKKRPEQPVRSSPPPSLATVLGPGVDVVDQVDDVERDALDEHLASEQLQLDCLVAVRAGRRAEHQAGEELARRVAAAKRSGASWHAIGLAVGMSGRGAQKRWDRANVQNDGGAKG